MDKDLEHQVRLLGLRIEEECIIGKALRMLKNRITRCLRLTREEFNRNSKCLQFLLDLHHQKKSKAYLVKQLLQELEEAKL